MQQLKHDKGALAAEVGQLKSANQELERKVKIFNEYLQPLRNSLSKEVVDILGVSD